MFIIFYFLSFIINFNENIQKHHRYRVAHLLWNQFYCILKDALQINVLRIARQTFVAVVLVTTLPQVIV